MPGEIQLNKLLKTMQPILNTGDYVFCTTKDLTAIESAETIMMFREQEGVTLILNKETADRLQLAYSFTAAWITLTVHSSLEAVGLTAAFSTALADQQISCNTVAGYFHDHIFIDKKDAEKAMAVLKQLAE